MFKIIIDAASPSLRMCMGQYVHLTVLRFWGYWCHKSYSLLLLLLSYLLNKTHHPSKQKTKFSTTSVKQQCDIRMTSSCLDLSPVLTCGVTVDWFFRGAPAGALQLHSLLVDTPAVSWAAMTLAGLIVAIDSALGDERPQEPWPHLTRLLLTRTLRCYKHKHINP